MPEFPDGDFKLGDKISQTFENRAADVLLEEGMDSAATPTVQDSPTLPGGGRSVNAFLQSSRLTQSQPAPDFTKDPERGPGSSISPGLISSGVKVVHHHHHHTAPLKNKMSRDRNVQYQSGLHYIIPSETPFEVDSLLYITHYLLHQAGIIYDNKSFVD